MKRDIKVTHAATQPDPQTVEVVYTLATICFSIVFIYYNIV